MINNYIQFISNNVKGLQPLGKNKGLWILKKLHCNNGFKFLQETHSTVYDEKRWQYELKGKWAWWPHDCRGVKIAVDVVLQQMNLNDIEKIYKYFFEILLL